MAVTASELPPLDPAGIPSIPPRVPPSSKLDLLYFLISTADHMQSWGWRGVVMFALVSVLAVSAVLYGNAKTGVVPQVVPVQSTKAFEPGLVVDVLKICIRAQSVTFAQMPDVTGVTRIATGKNEQLIWVDGKDKLGNQLTKATWSYTDTKGIAQPDKTVEVNQPAANCLRTVK